MCYVFNILQLLQPHHQSCACHPQRIPTASSSHITWCEMVYYGNTNHPKSSQISSQHDFNFTLHYQHLFANLRKKRSGDPLWKNSSTTDSGRLTLYQSLVDSACSGGIALPTYRCFFGKETICFGTTCCEVFSALWGLKWSNIFMKIRSASQQKFPHGLTLRKFGIKSQVFPTFGFAKSLRRTMPQRPLAMWLVEFLSYPPGRPSPSRRTVGAWRAVRSWEAGRGWMKWPWNEEGMKRS